MKQITAAPAGPTVKPALATATYVAPNEAYAISAAAAQEKCAAGLPKLFVLGLTAGVPILTYEMPLRGHCWLLHKVEQSGDSLSACSVIS